MKLADACRPYYRWVVVQAQAVVGSEVSLTEALGTLSHEELQGFLRRCFIPGEPSRVPPLFDGIGRQYPQGKAAFYFLSWLIRDAPQQRLQPLLSRAKRQATEKQDPVEVQVQGLALLFLEYRTVVQTFEWPAVREVVADRLEGSRRAIKGRQKEIIVRTAFTAALQSFWEEHESYGRFSTVRVSDKETRIGNETFDVTIDLLGENEVVMERILVPVKTRETEGGGHAHLFTRDINSAIRVARDADDTNWVAVVIVAQNWSAREQEHVHDIADHAVALEMSPTEFEELGDEPQRNLCAFVAGVLSGELGCK